ncbi:hypothetical protein EG68_02345 [Paragonimus skrjabini miyazakii]|uniref:SH2 domain-containing protein n=1 Tax=Paragonimus skrjabini miyazakii TaxID=59628 RepID=A0A8S9Z3K4_9TREM|nr:hypothetical protein EG68_02345 [Paragonimus skrjabini miyazakii]
MSRRTTISILREKLAELERMECDVDGMLETSGEERRKSSSEINSTGRQNTNELSPTVPTNSTAPNRAVERCKKANRPRAGSLRRMQSIEQDDKEQDELEAILRNRPLPSLEVNGAGNNREITEANTSDEKTQLINQRKSEHRMSRINTHRSIEHKNSIENGLQSVDQTRAGSERVQERVHGGLQQLLSEPDGAVHTQHTSSPGHVPLQMNSQTCPHRSPLVTGDQRSTDGRVPSLGSPIRKENPYDIFQVARNTSMFWYLPDITASAARSYLDNKPPWSFIVRRSTEPDAYKLSFKIGNGSIQRIVIDKTRNGFLIRNFRPIQHYPSVLHLVVALCSPNSLLPCPLRLPNCNITTNRPPVRMASEEVLRNEVPEVSTLHRTNSLRNSRRQAISPPEWKEPYRLSHIPQSSRIYDSTRSRRVVQISWPARVLLPQGAACKLFYFGQFGVGNLSGPHAIRICVDHIFDRQALRPSMQPILIQFRVNDSGLTVVDLTQRAFSQRYYPITFLLYIGPDPLYRKWTPAERQMGDLLECAFFGFISHNPNATPGNNQCHILAEHDPSESVQVICDFTNRYLNLSEV